jgi:hypothetical protein
MKLVLIEERNAVWQIAGCAVLVKLRVSICDG